MYIYICTHIYIHIYHICMYKYARTYMEFFMVYSTNFEKQKFNLMECKYIFGKHMMYSYTQNVHEI